MKHVARPSSLELVAKDAHLTRTRIEMDPDGLLAHSEAGPLWAKADIGPVIMSLRPMECGGVNAIRLYRTLDHPDFDDREAKIVHIILSEIPWLHFQEFPDANSKEIVNFYPRHRTVLHP